jgi:sirohydrochlorin ferrochelatase
MHKLIDSVNNKTDVWSRKGEILKSTYDLMNHDLTKSWRIRKKKRSNNMIAFEVEIGVTIGLQEIIPARVRMSRVYLCCCSIKPIPMD